MTFRWLLALGSTVMAIAAIIDAHNDSKQRAEAAKVAAAVQLAKAAKKEA